MLTFDNSGFTIRIDTVGNPVEDWLDLQQELLSVLSLLDIEDNIMPTPVNTLTLLSAMLPDWQAAKRMHPQATEEEKS